MYRDSTTDLNHRLLNASGTDSGTVPEDGNSIKSGRALIDSWLGAHKEITPADVVRACQGYLSRSYIYDILSGVKTAPSRDVTIMLCLAMKTDVKSADRILKAYGHRDLYPRDPRDLEIISCMTAGSYDISEVNDRLSARSHRLLGD